MGGAAVTDEEAVMSRCWMKNWIIAIVVATRWTMSNWWWMEEADVGWRRWSYFGCSFNTSSSCFLLSHHYRLTVCGNDLPDSWLLLPCRIIIIRWNYSSQIVVVAVDPISQQNTCRLVIKLCVRTWWPCSVRWVVVTLTCVNHFISNLSSITWWTANSYVN